jgi:quinol monooxygenase YgiN
MQYGLYTRLTAKDGLRDRLIEVLMESARLLEQVDGCVYFVVTRVAGTTDEICVMDVWRSREEHAEALAAEDMKALVAEARPLLAEMPQPVELEVVGGKGV